MRPDKSSKRTSESFCLATLTIFPNFRHASRQKLKAPISKLLLGNTDTLFLICFHAPRQKLKAYISKPLLGITDTLFQFAFMHPDRSSRQIKLKALTWKLLLAELWTLCNFIAPRQKLKAYISKLLLGNTDNLFQLAFMHPDKSSTRTSQSCCLATLTTFPNMLSCTPTKAQSIHLKAVARQDWHRFPNLLSCTATRAQHVHLKAIARQH